MGKNRKRDLRKILIIAIKCLSLKDCLKKNYLKKKMFIMMTIIEVIMKVMRKVMIVVTMMVGMINYYLSINKKSYLIFGYLFFYRLV